MRAKRSSVWSCVALALALASSSAAAALTPWHDLRSVSVTVSNGSLPPPDGKPRTTTFLGARRLQRAQAALNAHHITRLAKTTAGTGGCTGGANVTITIVTHNYTRLRMSAYECGNGTSGNIGGDLPGFLRAAGISLP